MRNLRLVMVLIALLPLPVPAVDCIAHRGDSSRFPDNSLAAIESAWNNGANIVEVDVRMTRDGSLVLFHDESLHKKAVKDLTHAELDSLVTSHRIPMLKACLQSAKAGQHLLLDLKETGIGFLDQVLVETGNFTPSGVTVTLQSTDLDALDHLREKAPQGTNLLYVTNLKSEPAAEKLAVTLKTRRLHGITAQGRRHVDGNFVAEFRKRGLTYYVWTINEADRMKHYATIRVDGIITDSPATFAKHLAAPAPVQENKVPPAR